DGARAVTPVAPVAAVRPAARSVLPAPEADSAPAAVARRDADPHLVHELHVARMVAEGGARLHAGLRREPHRGDAVGEAPEDRAGDARDDPGAGEQREERAEEEIAPPRGPEEEARRPL